LQCLQTSVWLAEVTYYYTMLDEKKATIADLKAGDGEQIAARAEL
jgi:hypothetical protein